MTDDKRPPRRPLGDFAESIGDSQERGSRDALGLLPDVGPTVVSPSPPHLRQVVSGYDARPIGGYDFVLHGQSELPPGDIHDPQILPIEFTSPRGYITVLRRIEFEPVPSLVLSGSTRWLLAVGGIVVPSWEWLLGPVIGERTLDTFIVVPPETTVGMFPLGGFAALVDAGLGASMEVILHARFIGNLILDTNDPPSQMVGSNPHRVVPIADPTAP